MSLLSATRGAMAGVAIAGGAGNSDDGSSPFTFTLMTYNLWKTDGEPTSWELRRPVRFLQSVYVAGQMRCLYTHLSIRSSTPAIGGAASTPSCIQVRIAPILSLAGGCRRNLRNWSADMRGSLAREADSAA